MSDIAAMPLAGGTFTGNVSLSGSAQFVAPRAAVQDLLAQGNALSGVIHELDVAQRD